MLWNVASAHNLLSQQVLPAHMPFILPYKTKSCVLSKCMCYNHMLDWRAAKPRGAEQPSNWACDQKACWITVKWRGKGIKQGFLHLEKSWYSQKMSKLIKTHCKRRKRQNWLGIGKWKDDKIMKDDLGRNESQHMLKKISEELPKQFFPLVI